MRPNYKYVIEKCTSLSPGRILDYGCGRGEIIDEARKLGMEMYGVEAFYAGSDIRHILEDKGYLGDAVRELKDDKIPFDDQTFDLVVSNMVFEHVRDLEIVAHEISRVLKPNGKLLCLFPTSDVFREPHCGVPFVHWFSKDSKIRYYWLLVFRMLGFGFHKQDKSVRQWATDLLHWVNSYTFYRSVHEVHTTLLNKFVSLSHLEEDYISFRFRNIRLYTLAKLSRAFLIKPFSRLFCRKFGMIVILASKK